MDGEKISDQILQTAREKVETAVRQFQFSAGNPTTGVLPGYPYAVVSDLSAKTRKPGDTELVSRITPYYRRQGEKIQFFPYDHTISAQGKSCYASPPPLFTLPPGKIFFFLELKILILADTKCYGGNPAAVPPTYGTAVSFPKSAQLVSGEIKMVEEIPHESPAEVVSPCQGVDNWTPDEANWYWPGLNTFNVFIVAKSEGGADAPLRDLLLTGEYGLDSFGDPVSERDYYFHYNGGSWQSVLDARLESPGNTGYMRGVQSNTQPVMGSMVNPP